MKYTIHYTNNARAAARGAGEDEISDIEFEGTLNDVLNFAAWMMSGEDGGEDDYANAVKNGDWEVCNDKDAKDAMNSADLGFGNPVVFYIKDSRGRMVYNSGLDESDWETQDEEDEEYEVDDEEDDEGEEEEEPWTGGDFEIKDGVFVKYHGEGGSVVIPNGVTKIGSSAFSSYANKHFDGNGFKRSSFLSIIIPDSVKIIEDTAFSGCGGTLKSVTIPNSVKYIGMGAFRGCWGLTNVTIPNSVGNIEANTFSECYGLKSVTIPDSVKHIDFNAFGYCKFKSVTIPKNCKVNEYAFPETCKVVRRGNETLSENQKVTLTLGQLKRLIKESVARDADILFNDDENTFRYEKMFVFVNSQYTILIGANSENGLIEVLSDFGYKSTEEIATKLWNLNKGDSIHIMTTIWYRIR